MTEFRGIGKSVGDYLAGNLASQRALQEMRECKCNPDHLYRVIRDAHPSFANDYLRGYLRALQKALEREAAHG